MDERAAGLDEGRHIPPKAAIHIIVAVFGKMAVFRERAAVVLKAVFREKCLNRIVFLRQLSWPVSVPIC
jgi:hypothetical protein